MVLHCRNIAAMAQRVCGVVLFITNPCVPVAEVRGLDERSNCFKLFVREMPCQEAIVESVSRYDLQRLLLAAESIGIRNATTILEICRSIKTLEIPRSFTSPGRHDLFAFFHGRVRLEKPATLTPVGHSFLRLNQHGGRGSIFVGFPGDCSHLVITIMFHNLIGFKGHFSFYDFLVAPFWIASLP